MTRIFEDVFGTGDFSLWDETEGTVAIITSPTYHGAYAAKATGERSFWLKRFAAQPDLYAGFAVYFPSLLPVGSGAIIFGAWPTDWSEAISLHYYGEEGKFLLDTPFGSAWSNTTVQPNTFYYVVVRRKVGDATTGKAQLWINGILEVDLTGPITGDTALVWSGIPWSNQPDFSAIFDDYKIDSVPISPEVPPPPPTPQPQPQVSGWGGMRPVEASRYTNIENDSARSSPASQVFAGEVASNAELTFLELKRRGYNAHRVAFSIPALGGDPNWGYDENNMKRMVAIAKKLDMWLIFTWGGYYEQYTRTNDWIAFWQSVIPVFKDLYEKIIWEPVNEPVMNPLTGSQAVAELGRIYQRWIDMCRGFGDGHWIVVSCACWYLDIPYVEWFPSVADPLNQVFLGAHFYYFYEWNQSKWTVADANANADGNLANIRQVIARYGRPYICTEMGATCFSPNYEYDQVPGARYGGASGYSDVSLAFMQRMVSSFMSAGWSYILFPCADWCKDWPPGWHYTGLYGGLDVWGQYVPQPVPPVTFTLSILSNVGGTTDPPPSVLTLAAGSVQPVVPLPDSGYQHAHWLFDGVNQDPWWPAGSTILITMDADHTVQPVFEYVPPPVVYSLILSTSIGGTTNPVPGRYDYEEGTSAIVTALPDASYRFVHWELDGTVRTENPITVLMNTDYSLRAVFEYVPPPPTTADIQGTVKDKAGNPLAGATVTCDGFADITEVDGSFQFLGIEPKRYTVTASKEGYVSQAVIVVLQAGTTVTLDFALTPPTPPPLNLLPLVLLAGLVFIAPKA